MTSHLGELAELGMAHLWQVSAVAVAILVFVRLFCRNRPHLAYALLLIVLVKCITPPIVSGPIGVFGWTWKPNGESRSIQNLIAISSGITRDNGGASISESDELLTNESAVVRSEAAPLRSRFRVGAYLLLAWAIGAAASGTFVGVTWIRHLKAIRRSSTPATGWLVQTHQRLLRDLGLKRPVKLLVSHESFGPCCFGVVSPCVVVPHQLVTDTSNKNMEPLLAHELIHIRRGDPLIAFIQMFAAIVWWFNPLVWCVVRRLSREREKCCDVEVVAGTGCDPDTYAQGMLDVLKIKRTARRAVLTSGIRPVDVTQERLETIMNRNTRLHLRTPKTYWLILALGVILLAPGAAGVSTVAGESADTSQSFQTTTGTGSTSEAKNSEQDTNSDRQFANTVIRLHGTVAIRLQNGRQVEVDLLAYLPNEPFELVGVTLGDFNGVRSENPSQTPIDGSVLERAKECQYIETMQLRLVNVTDEGLKNLSHSKNISKLVLSRANLYGDGLVHLAELQELQELSLERNQISDASLKYLTGLKKIQSLNLYGCPLTDAAVEHLKQLTELKHVDLRGTHLSRSAIAKLRITLPNCSIRDH